MLTKLRTLPTLPTLRDGGNQEIVWFYLTQRLTGFCFHRGLSVCFCAINRRVAQTLQVRFRKIRVTGSLWTRKRAGQIVKSSGTHSVYFVVFIVTSVVG